MRKTIVIGCVLFISGCFVGKNVRKEPAAITAAGAVGWVEANRVHYEGTLLAITDTTLVLQLGTSQRLIEVPTRVIRHFDFNPFGGGSNPTAAELNLLRQASRFPFGIPESALASLLARADQAAIERIQ